MEPRRGFIFGLLGAAVVWCALLLDHAGAITVDDLILAESYEIEAVHELPLGDEMVQGVQLEMRVHLYNNVYDYIYINTNGILTFNAGYPEFLNQPLPIEYPAIAPFYSNVDTSAADPALTTISYFESSDSRLLRHLESSLYGAFPKDVEFSAIGAFVVTWSNVGHFDGKTESLNTYQAVIVSSEDKTYVQFLYPEDGLNWIQADIGQSGLNDVRAQAGFISEDGRFFKLPGSGTDNVAFLHDLTNSDEPGSWWFLVGPIAYPHEIIEPHNDAHLAGLTQAPVRPTCATHSRQCHGAASCSDTATGFCCTCRTGYIGNGFVCLRGDAPVRVSGRVAGTLGSEAIETQLQAYVSLADGQTFLAVSPLEPAIGQKLQLLQLLAGPVGWLFAVRTDGAQNGYQLTGGKFNHTTTLRFHESDRQITVTQQFLGLNLWDQLEVEVLIEGDLPDVVTGAQIVYPDGVEEFVYAAESTLRSIGTPMLKVNDVELFYSVVQQIEYERCPYAEDELAFAERPTVFNKVFKVSSAYSPADSALRIGMFNKITLKRDSSACTDGTATCGENTVCQPGGGDLFECVCTNGYTPSVHDQHSCSDIDECAAESTHICDSNAVCINNPGGYSCQCAEGFVGNGFKCSALSLPLGADRDNEIVPSGEIFFTHEEYQPEVVAVEAEDLSTHHNELSPETAGQLCGNCAENADCHEGVCECRQGYEGDGVQCELVCDEYSVRSPVSGQCVLVDVHAGATSSEDEEDDEVLPFCHLGGCSCPTGFRLEESAEEKTCRKVPQDSEQPAEIQTQEDDKLPCDAENNCSPNASCEFIDTVFQHKCVCNEGFTGNGHECVELEVSCTIVNNCHELAVCLYDEELGKSVCRCDKGYEGDGRHQCEPAPECRVSEQCGDNAVCNGGVCECADGFEKGQGDLCVLAGACGGAYCVDIAHCEWDATEEVAYCQCPPNYRGDGVHECVFVPPPCNVQNNCGLNAACSPDHRDASVYTCVCNAGFNGDGLVCTPEENCINTPSLCHPDATCVSATTGLNCVCNTGFVGNGSYCSEPPRFEADFLLVSRGLSAIRVPLNASSRSHPIVMSHLIMGLDKDCTHGRVYWSDIIAKCIMSSTYDGRDKRPFITEDIRSPEGVAVDWISRRLYWTDSEKDTVEVASLDDPTVRAVVVHRNLVNPRGIAFDPLQNKIYWSDWNRIDPKIEWANLDGSERETLLAQPHVLLPNHVAISPRTRDLCFVDAGTKKLNCIDTHRKETYTVADNLSYPFGLAITDSQFYWSDWTSQRIESANHTNHRLPPLSIPVFSHLRMYGLTAITDDCPLYYSPCQVANGGCPSNRMCLINQKSPGGIACKCLATATDCSDEDYYA